MPDASSICLPKGRPAAHLGAARGVEDLESARVAQAVGQAPLAGLGQAHSVHRPLLRQDAVGGRVRQPVPQAQRPHRALNRVGSLQQSTLFSKHFANTHTCATGQVG